MGDGRNCPGVFGWMQDPGRFSVVTYLALGPGLVGHTGYNGVLRYVSPLVVSITLTFEPLLGSLLGWAMGVSDKPGRGSHSPRSSYTLFLNAASLRFTRPVLCFADVTVSEETKK